MTIKTASNQKDGSTICAHMILPFVEEEGDASKLTKDNSVTLELLVNPAAPTTSAKVKTNVRKVSSTESPQDIIQWTNDLINQVFPAMGLTTGLSQKAVLNTITTGNAHVIVVRGTHTQSTAERLKRAIAVNIDVTHADHLAVIAEDLDSTDNLTTAMIVLTIFEIIKLMMPQHSLVKVKHYL
jgi:hypothetical protein